MAQEVETTLATFVERGVTAESDLLASIAAFVPPEVMTQLPPEVRDMFNRYVPCWRSRLPYFRHGEAHVGQGLDAPMFSLLLHFPCSKGYLS